MYYDTAQIASSNTNTSPVGDRANYYFDTTSAFKMQIQAGGHTFANANHPQGYSCGYVGIEDQFNNHDGFSVDTESSIIQLDGSDWLVGKEFGILSLYLGDSSKTAFSSATIPTSPPELASFPDTHAVWITGRYDDGHSTLFNVGGVITNITQIEQVFLNVRRIAPQTIQLAWPVVASGFQLQTRSDLNAGDWQDLVAPIVDNTTDHTVTLPATGDAAFFRLTK